MTLRSGTSFIAFCSMCTLFFGGTVASAVLPKTLDPWVSYVLSSDWIGDKGDFFRLIVRNTEKDPCLELNTVNLRSSARVVQLNRFCDFDRAGTPYSLQNAQSVSYAGFRWDQTNLIFQLEYAGTGSATPTRKLECRINAADVKPRIVCGDLKS